MLVYKRVKNYDSEFEPLQLSNIPLEGIKEVFFETSIGYETSKVSGSGANIDLYDNNACEEEKFIHFQLLRDDYLFIGILDNTITVHSQDDSEGDEVNVNVIALKIIYDDGLVITIKEEKKPILVLVAVDPKSLPRDHPDFDNQS
jgi:hypothetical protein